MPTEQSSRQRVVIIGGGFGGLYAARKLGTAPVDVTLIDCRNFHLFQPLLYQVATGGLSPGDIASPLRAVLHRYKNIHIIKSKVTDIEPKAQQIFSNDKVIPYDILILAAGMTHYYYGHQEWARVAPGLKEVEDALEIRRRIFNAFEEAEKSEDPDRQRELLTFVIVGGGATGVELAGALGELAHSTLKNDFRNINPTQARILLIEGGERILPGFNPGLSVKAEKALRKLGVSILTRTQLVEIDGDTVHLHSNGEDSEIRAATVLWAAGVKANVLGEKLAAKTGAATDKSGRIIVTEYLTVPGYENIFVVGDMAHFAHQTGEPLPGVAPVAMQEGRYVASMIKRKLSGKPLKPFQYLDKGSMAVIGRNNAIAQFKKWKIGGWFAWITWLFVHIAYLIEFDNKLLVLIQWAYNYFTRKRGARLITTEKERCHQIESRNE